MSFKFEPVGNLVAIRPDDVDVVEKVSGGGIILPQKYKDPSLTGIVLAKGPGLMTEDGSRLQEDGFEVGDRVLFLRYTAYVQYDENGVLYTILPDTDIIATLDEDDVVENVKV